MNKALSAASVDCICGGSWNLANQSIMACSYQPVLLTIEFIRMVGGGSKKEREREDVEDRTSTKRGKHVGHCVGSEYGSGFSTQAVVVCLR